MSGKTEAEERVVQLCAQHDKLFAITSAGRVFMRMLDSRNFDGRNPEKFIWKEIELPV